MSDVRAVANLRERLLAMNPDALSLDAVVDSLVRGLSMEAVLQQWQPSVPSLAPPCRHCSAIGTVTVTMQQLRSGDEAEEAVASCSRCRRRYRLDL